MKNNGTAQAVDSSLTVMVFLILRTINGENYGL